MWFSVSLYFTPFSVVFFSFYFSFHFNYENTAKTGKNAPNVTLFISRICFENSIATRYLYENDISPEWNDLIHIALIVNNCELIAKPKKPFNSTRKLIIRQSWLVWFRSKMLLKQQQSQQPTKCWQNTQTWCIWSN